MRQSASLEHLLWALNAAIGIAREDSPQLFSTEKSSRQFIAQWLTTARREPDFKSMTQAFSWLRGILDRAPDRSAVDLLYRLWKRCVSVDKAPFLCWQAALNALSALGWRHRFCPEPDVLLGTVLSLRHTRQKHLSPAGKPRTSARYRKVGPQGTRIHNGGITLNAHPVRHPAIRHHTHEMNSAQPENSPTSRSSAPAV